MIIISKEYAERSDIENIAALIRSRGGNARILREGCRFYIYIEGDLKKLNEIRFEIMPAVEKLAKEEDLGTEEEKTPFYLPKSIRVGGREISASSFQLIAGPCAVESRKQLLSTAKAVKEAGAGFLRGGAYKPRTSPYSFQGLEEEGLKLLREAKEETGLALVSEATSARSLESAVKYVDMIQIGSRNMQNFELLKEAGKCGRPVLLKRGFCATIEEWLNAAEYIMAEGNANIVLCERGIRTFEHSTRNTLDISAPAVLRRKTDLPVFIDPSHASGFHEYVAPLAKAAVAAGADGLLIEVHPDPSRALSDGRQSLSFEAFRRLAEELKPYIELTKKCSL
ncbi:MAG: 3-deoxy-7-phosphoheptulonate synthase [Johnsonella sp.]|nr:3-deoxy-7-phosphoheptulonate synthase [Johnsonella sp.]